EHMNCDVTAKAVAKASSRALGLVISKSKSAEGLPYSKIPQNYMIQLCGLQLAMVPVFGVQRSTPASMGNRIGHVDNSLG
ncbi:MAG: hypothetical protein AB2693_27335, partial [Candidatus Thiodiazotropha sp.]